MPGLFARLPVLFAQAAPAADPGSGGLLSNLLPFMAVPLLFYLLIWRPKQQEDRKRQEMLGTLKKNDKVLTGAGIYGTVVSVDDDQDRVVLRVDDDRGVRIAFNRASVVRILEASHDKAAERAAESATK
jgi:preprotein translocase subunit YajC